MQSEGILPINRQRTDIIFTLQCFWSRFTESGSKSTHFAESGPDTDPGSCWIQASSGSRLRLFMMKKNPFDQNNVPFVFLNPYKGHSDSARGIQPNRKLFEHKNFLIFPFFEGTTLFGLPGSGSANTFESGSETRNIFNNKKRAWIRL